MENVRESNIGESDYSKKKIQSWDIWRNWKLDPFEANVVKYTLRSKPGKRLEDLKKACHYLQEILVNTNKVPKRRFNTITYTAEEIIEEYNLHEKAESEVVHHLRCASKTNDLIEYKQYIKFALLDLQKIIIGLENER